MLKKCPAEEEIEEVVDGLNFADFETEKPKSMISYPTEPVFQAKAHLNGGACVAFSPNGNRVATAGIDGDVKVWNLHKVIALNRSKRINFIDDQYVPPRCQSES